MSDETAPASAVEVQMILDQDEYMSGGPMSPRAMAHSPLLEHASSAHAHAPGEDNLSSLYTLLMHPPWKSVV